MSKETERRKSGKRTSLYRLAGSRELKDLIRKKYRDSQNFTDQAITMEGRDGYLITGAMAKDAADWCERVATLTGASVKVQSSTPAGVLLIRQNPENPLEIEDSEDHPEQENITGSSKNIVYALCYGMGFQLLEPSKVDNNFGQRIAIRVADPTQLRSITVTTMDERSRTSRATIPSGDGILGFGVGEIGEVVSRIVADAELTQLSRANDDKVQIRGADALSLPIGLNAAEVLDDLDYLEELLSEEPIEQLKAFEQLTAIKNPETRKKLDDLLCGAFSDDGSLLGLAWPHERIDENGTPDSWKPNSIFPRGRNKVRQGQPEWTEIKEALKSTAPDKRLGKLNRTSIQIYRDSEGTEPISPEIKLKRWIAFETELEAKSYALYDGNWYQVGHEYADYVNKRTKEIFSRSAEDLEFPVWKPSEDEASYNKKLTSSVNGICLDRKLITTPLHGRGIEACDVFSDDGSFIHVKRIESSDKASHLFAQALVSADALCNDQEAREKLKKKIRELGGDPKTFSNKPNRVVLAVHRRDQKLLEADDLFTFSKVNLIRQVEALESRNVPVRIVTIPGR